MAEKPIVLTDKSRQVLAFLQANEGGFFGDQIAEATGLNARGIHGVLNSLVKHAFVQKEKAMREVTVLDKEDNEKVVEKEFTLYSLTEAGMAYVIE